MVILVEWIELTIKINNWWLQIPEDHGGCKVTIIYKYCKLFFSA